MKPPVPSFGLELDFYKLYFYFKVGYFKYSDLTAFQAARQIDLQWVSNTGYKNDYFVIEKSTDGQTFVPMQEMTNKDFSDEVAAFSIVDETPITGVNYYKVKHVHVYGTFEYSEVRTVEFNIDLDKVGIYPNPAQETVSVNLSEYQGKQGNCLLYTSPSPRDRG